MHRRNRGKTDNIVSTQWRIGINGIASLLTDKIYLENCNMSKTALIYPPVCDPTAPYLSVPLLTAFLRSAGEDVIQMDANICAFEYLLQKERLWDFWQRVERRLHRLRRHKTLSHTKQLAMAVLSDAHQQCRNVPDQTAEALAVLRDRSGRLFFDPACYEKAVGTVEKALRLISAAFTPLHMDFDGYHTPFGFLTPSETEYDAHPERNPFHEYFSEILMDRLASEKVRTVGISIVFPGQMQPAWSLARMIRKRFPDLHITAGGPAITQLLIRLDENRRKRVLYPFHSAVLFEGEKALLDLIRMRESGLIPPEIIFGSRMTDLSALPHPDFQGLPLDSYFSPEIILPYDTTRGCYWGKCAFCHYGLTEKGTAPYRERDIGQITEHIRQMMAQYSARIFYFSQDTIAPKTAVRLAESFKNAGIACRWATDIRAEPYLASEDRCRILAEGGALSMSLGIESASPRVLKMISKGISVKDMGQVIAHLSKAGIAVEAMCFTDFPTETCADADATIRFIRDLREHISLFHCGRFDLSHGSMISRNPEKFGISEIWQVKGDELGTGLFYSEEKPAKTEREREKTDAEISSISRHWWFNPYPWAGSLSTAHTLLWYDHYGPDVFRRFSTQAKGFSDAYLNQNSAYDEVFEREAEIWHKLIYEKRSISRGEYRELADRQF